MSNKLRGLMKLLATILVLLLSSIHFPPYIQASDGLEWTKYYGGDGDEILHNSIKTSDNCILLVGESNSNTQNNYDVYIAKIDQNGTFLWEKTYGDWSLHKRSYANDAGYSVIETSDAYLVTGNIYAHDGIGEDVLLLNIDKNGQNMWGIRYGGNAWDWGKDLIQNHDNNTIIVGATQDFIISYYDTLLIETNKGGKLLWKKRYKKSGNQYPSSIIQTSTNDYLITGTTSDATNTELDIFVTKIDSNGKEIWFKKYGGKGKEKGVKMIETPEGYIIVGKTESIGAGKYDIYLLKIDQNGNLLREQTIGTSADDEGLNILQNPDGSILVTGGTFNKSEKSMDVYLATLDSNGEITYEQTYGTSNYEKGIATHQFTENEYYITGYIGSRQHNFFLMKILLKKFNLVIQSPVGETYGTGKYYLGATPTFGIEKEVVQTEDNIRYLFSGWTSSTDDGYTGPDNPVKITMQNDTTQTAEWKTQYLVEFKKEGEGEINGESGWYDKDTVIEFEAIPVGEDEFLEWEGQGPGSYSGRDASSSIVVNGPITQKAKFGTFPLWHVLIESEYGEVMGSGEYREGSTASFSVDPPIVSISSEERAVFSEWINPIGLGYSGKSNQASITVKGNIHQKAVWKKQYYVEIICDDEHAKVPQSGWYDKGEAVSLETVPENGYKLDRWEIDDGQNVSIFDSNHILLVNQSIIAIAYIEPTSKPNYSLIIAIGSIVCVPIIIKSWISHIRQDKN